MSHVGSGEVRRRDLPIVPKSLLLLKFKYLNCDNMKNSLGRVPCSWLLCRYSSSSDCNDEMNGSKWFTSTLSFNDNFFKRLQLLNELIPVSIVDE